MASNNTNKLKKVQRDYMNELVDITLSKPEHITSKETHAQIIINGKLFYVAYGQSQKVPRYVKEFIDNNILAENVSREAKANLVKQGKEPLNPAD